MAVNPSDYKQEFKKFTNILEELCGIVQSLSGIERSKTEAASQNRHEAMDHFLKEEQALLLKLRGQEQHRMKLQEELGWKDLTFRQILAKADEGQRRELEPLFHRLDEALSDFFSARDTSDRIVKVKLREIEILLARRGIQSYDGDGSVTAPPPFHLHDTYG